MKFTLYQAVGLLGGGNSLCFTTFLPKKPRAKILVKRPVSTVERRKRYVTSALVKGARKRTKTNSTNFLCHEAHGTG
jgi:hypothetical protein